MSHSTLCAIRRSARAGQFYPADPSQMYRAVDRYLAVQHAPRRHVRAVMLPHAGWQFCGGIIGQTLAHIHVPSTIIILGPRHTPFGTNWSIAPHEYWEIPGGRVAIATDIVSQLTAILPDLHPEPDAHVVEHGTEVLLPFIHRINPRARVVPIVLGTAYYQATHLLADALAHVIAAHTSPVLLMISSDMNHFAAEAENRRLDTLAIEAILTGDPELLYQTCEQHHISMCGLTSAVTVMQALQNSTPEIHPQLIAYTTSAATTHDLTRVVGYAGMVVP